MAMASVDFKESKNEGTYNCFFRSIARSLFSTSMEVLEDSRRINIFMRSIMFFIEYFLIVLCVLAILVLLLKLHMCFY
jgi:hypothetical protein